MGCSLALWRSRAWRNVGDMTVSGQELRIDAVIEDSFPASDPPSWTTGTAEAGRAATAPSEEESVNEYKVGYFVGSLAKASINRRLAGALVRLAPASMVLTEIPFRDLPLYSYDYDADFPPVARTFKAQIAVVDAVLFVTPEYNRSIPGGLKNAIDWASRPYGKNSFTRKPSAIIGASPGKIGTAIAQTHLRSILAFCNSPLMNSIEAYIQFEPGLITEAGDVTNEATSKFLRDFMSAFGEFIGRVYTVLPRSALRA